ncbi:hypothetical protein [Xanthomonas euroxanthea]|uniref:hypothetical protein n=1 Tax=Xanthomonas euroxanthea TaxID=2259622 RepID=UPI001F30A469|nr:hypothetical protein [Xanthomonas euroxanthea]
MTVLTLMGALGAFALLSELPMFLFVLWAQLTQAKATKPDQGRPQNWKHSSMIRYQ